MAFNWRQYAACKTGDAEALFASGRHQQKALRICTPCPVREQCLEWALSNNVQWGVWGGKTERQRQRLTGSSKRKGDWSYGQVYRLRKTSGI